MKTFKESQIIEEYQACAYCGDPLSSTFSYRGCCGEVHSTKYYVVQVGDCEDVYSEDEVSFEDDSEDHLKGSDPEERIKA